MVLENVFMMRDPCVSAFWEDNVSDAQVIPQIGETAATLVKRIQQSGMFDDIYVTVTSKEETLNDKSDPQSRRIAFGVVHSQGFQLDGVTVAKLFHVGTARSCRKGRNAFLVLGLSSRQYSCHV
jgi:hypothetical protein